MYVCTYVCMKVCKYTINAAATPTCDQGEALHHAARILGDQAHHQPSKRLPQHHSKSEQHDDKCMYGETYIHT